MLGASYGVATSVYTEKGKLKKRHLEKFGREIFDLVFSDQAPYKQININIKEFALGIIQVALRINPSLLSAVEKSKIIKPHKEDPKFKWHQSFDIDRNKLQPGQSPLHMDFENYTIGNLVPERHNYDYSNKDYLRIRRQILWRIYNLGYDYNKFEKIDKNISQSDFYRHTENVGKIERYGKKYSWVAFYEMAGYLENRGLLSAYRWRLSDSDVDPSFPEQPNIGSIYNSLNIPDVPLEDFILGDYVPVIEGGFSKRTLANTLGPWIIIDGLIDRIKDDKKIFIFIRGFFVKKKDFHKTIEFLKDITYPGNNKLPESITQHETFAGEIPWSEHWVEYDKDSKKLQINGSTTSVILASSNYNHPGNSANINVFTSFPSVSKELARNLKLESGYPTVDTFELNGKRATVLVSTGEIYRNHESLLYLRKDLLEKFLQENDLRFLLYSWGERNYNPFIERVERRIHNSRFDNIENILHKQGHYYENDEFIKFL
jgi:hypothetical protein